MPHEGYADPIMNDEPKFHSNIPISELTEHDTRAIEACDVSPTTPVAETVDGVMIKKMSRPSTGPRYAWGLEKSWTHKVTKCAVAERWLGSLVKPNPNNGRGSGLTRGLIRAYLI